MEDWHQAFVERKIKAKEVFYISKVDKSEAYNFIRKYHYLGDAKFFAKFCYGLFSKESNGMVAVATYSNPQGISAMKSWFNLPNSDQSVVELSRLCTIPYLNGTNATSFLLGNSIKMLKREGVKAVITLADNGRHSGSIYQVCNFKYFGLTDKKSDFYTSCGKVNPRGATKDVQGVWLPRTQKHRYMYLLDPKLECQLKGQSRPAKGDTEDLQCCNGSLQVLDRRYGKVYSCPICTGKAEEVSEA